MKYLVAIVFFLQFALIPLVWSANKEKSSQPRQEKVHQHGIAKVGIAFEGGTGKIDFESSAASIVGFEYMPKSKKDQKIQSDSLAKLESNFSEMVVFDPLLKCNITAESSEFNRTGSHADLKATFQVKCEKTPLNTVVKFYFQKFFPRLETVEVQALISELQLSTTVKKDATELELKNP